LSTDYLNVRFAESRHSTIIILALIDARLRNHFLFQVKRDACWDNTIPTLISAAPFFWHLK